MLRNELQPIPSVKASLLSSLLLLVSSFLHSLLPIWFSGDRTMAHIDSASIAWLLSDYVLEAISSYCFSPWSQVQGLPTKYGIELLSP